MARTTFVPTPATPLANAGWMFIAALCTVGLRTLRHRNRTREQSYSCYADRETEDGPPYGM
jgi:hypothetical protein